MHYFGLSHPYHKHIKFNKFSRDSTKEYTCLSFFFVKAYKQRKGTFLAYLYLSRNIASHTKMVLNRAGNAHSKARAALPNTAPAQSSNDNSARVIALPENIEQTGT